MIDNNYKTGAKKIFNFFKRQEQINQTKNKPGYRAWWHAPIIPTLWKPRQEDCEFEASLNCTAKSCISKQANKSRSRDPEKNPTTSGSERIYPSWRASCVSDFLQIEAFPPGGGDSSLRLKKWRNLTSAKQFLKLTRLTGLSPKLNKQKQLLGREDTPSGRAAYKLCTEPQGCSSPCPGWFPDATATFESDVLPEITSPASLIHWAGHGWNQDFGMLLVPYLGWIDICCHFSGESQGTTWKVCFVQVPTANIASFAAPGSLLHSLSYANTGSKQPETKSAGRNRPCRKVISQHTPSALQWKSTLIQMFSPFKAMKIIPRPWNRFDPWVTDTNFWLKNLRISPVVDVSIYFHWFLLLRFECKVFAVGWHSGCLILETDSV